MNEIILFLLAVVGVFSIACSYALITLGKMVDEFPLGDETTRTRGITSPAETTKIAVILFWILFLPGAWAVLQEGVVLIIVGITVLFAICLFMLTAMVFSFAVLGTMSRRKNENSDTVMRGKHTASRTSVFFITCTRESPRSIPHREKILSQKVWSMHC